MSSVSDGLITTPISFENTGTRNVKKAKYGEMNSMHAEVMELAQYSGVESEEKGVEVYKKEEILVVQADRFSRIPKKLKDLSPQESIAAAPLIESFRRQKDSTDTLIASWEAVNPQERLQLANVGIFSVEQLAKVEEHDMYKLGIGGKDLKARADRHLSTKEDSKPEDNREELAALRAELEKKNAHIQTLDQKVEDILKREAAKAAVKAPVAKTTPKKKAVTKK